MDVDIVPPPPFSCFICEGLETGTKKLTQATSRGYPSLLKYVEAVGNPDILARMKEAYDLGILKYHLECKTDLYNRYAQVVKASSSKCDLFY